MILWIPLEDDMCHFLFLQPCRNISTMFRNFHTEQRKKHPGFSFVTICRKVMKMWDPEVANFY